jgi:hypothetical protein
MPEALQKIAEWAFDEKMPGFQWVIFALLMFEFWLGVEGLRGAGIAIGMAILLSYVGSKSDFFFDWLYGTDPSFKITSLRKVPAGSYLVVDGDFRGDGSFVGDRKFSLPDWWRDIKARTPARSGKTFRDKMKALFRRVPIPGRQALDEDRNSAADKLHQSSLPVDQGLYKSCVFLLHPTDAWPRINAPLQLSKVFRALTILSILIALLEGFGIDWVQWLQGRPEAHSAPIASSDWPAGLSIITDWFQSLWAKTAECWSSLKTVLTPWGLALITAGITLVISFYYRIRHMRVLYTEAATAGWIKPTDPLATPKLRFNAHERALLKRRFWNKGLSIEQGFRVRRWWKRFTKYGAPPKIPYAVQTMQAAGLIRLERVDKELKPDNNGKYLQARFIPGVEKCLEATRPGLKFWRRVWRRVLRWVSKAWRRGSALVRLEVSSVKEQL